MKRIISLIVCIATLVTVLSGCGSFFAEPEVKIKSIDSELLDDGQTKITINYVDSTMKPLEFLIPPGKEGEQGKQGVGVNVTHQHIDDSTEVIVSYTDGREPTKFYIPDGMYAVGTSPVMEDEFGLYIVFTYSDGSKSDNIYLPRPEKGEKGDRGNGVNKHYQEEDENYIYLHIEFDDGKKEVIEIPKSVGITNIEAGIAENGEDYAIIVTFSNGTSTTIDFTRPPRWYSGSTRPSSAIGRDGDYYFDEVNQNIYRMIDGDWGNPIISLGEPTTKVTVTFNVNDSLEEPASMIGDYTRRFYPGECFATNNYYNGFIPKPTRDGYIFDGWYATTAVDPLLNSRFTDLTTISSDITLYARWIPET